MKNLYVFLSTLLLVISTWAIAEEVELLDTYLEEVPSGTSSHQLDSGAILGQPEEVVVDDTGQEYRRVETADGSELYEAVPAHSATDHQLYEDIPGVRRSSCTFCYTGYRDQHRCTGYS